MEVIFLVVVCNVFIFIIIKNGCGVFCFLFVKIFDMLMVLDFFVLQIEFFGWLVGNDVWKVCVVEVKVVGCIDVNENSGLGEIFEEIFLIEDFGEMMQFLFMNFYFELEKYLIEECKEWGKIYVVLLYVEVEFMNYFMGEIKIQMVFMGDFLLQIDKGMFIINGFECVVVLQFVCFFGVYFDKIFDKMFDKDIVLVCVILSCGVWFEFEIDKCDQVGVCVDCKCKQLVMVFFKVLGMISEEIFVEFVGYILIEEMFVKDMIVIKEDVFCDIYCKLCLGEQVVVEVVCVLFDNFYFNLKCYDFVKVGCYKINYKLGFDQLLILLVLIVEDIVVMIKYLVCLYVGIEEIFEGICGGKKVEICFVIDDIDNFGNCCICVVGELIQNQVCMGLFCMECVVCECMIMQDIEVIMLQILINVCFVVVVIKEFFGMLQLLQFMDQNNLFVGLMNKCCLFVFGFGGFLCDCVGVEVCDVYFLYYGCMCLIEMLEGLNIGLIGVFVIFVCINFFGFIEMLYCKVVDGVVIDQIDYFIVLEEVDFNIVQVNVLFDVKGCFCESYVLVCFKGGSGEVDLFVFEEIGYIDVFLCQMVLVVILFVLFFEYDDVQCVFMGVNMQCQVVLLLCSDLLFVGIGMEGYIVIDVGDVIIVEKVGVVFEVFVDCVVVMFDEGGMQEYYLCKFDCLNQGIFYNQKVVVNVGECVEVGEVIVDGFVIENGELVFGKNFFVVFMMWEGYNFEDVIILSQDLVKDDIFFLIYIEEYEVDVCDIKFGKEEIICDFFNVSLELLKDFDECGIICIGVEVCFGDIFVGKVMLKGEIELLVEECLFCVIFNEKSCEVCDMFLKVFYGEQGMIIVVKEFNVEDGDDEFGFGVNCCVVVYIVQKCKIIEGDKFVGCYGNKGVIVKIFFIEDMLFLLDGMLVDIVLNLFGIFG